MAARDDVPADLVGSCVALGTELIVRATRGICTGSLLNADAGRALTNARIQEWAAVLPLYENGSSRLTA
jgi:hypothetical protein